MLPDKSVTQWIQISNEYVLTFIFYNYGPMTLSNEYVQVTFQILSLTEQLSERMITRSSTTWGAF